MPNPMTLLGIGGAAAAPFAPTDIAGLALWLKSDAGLYQERTGAAATTPAAADGDPVGTWVNQAAATYEVAAADASRPALKLNIQNGRAVVRGDGVDDLLTVASGLTHNYPLTVFLVLAQQEAAAGYVLTLANSGCAIIEHFVGANQKEFFGGGPRLLIGTVAQGTFGIYSYTVDDAMPNQNVATYLNGGAGGSGAGAVDDESHNFTLFSDTGASTQALCDIGEVLVYNTALSAPNLALVEAYLNTRWAVY